MHVVGYARVSKDDQADSLPAQVSRLEAAGCSRVITDVETGHRQGTTGSVVLQGIAGGAAADAVCSGASARGGGGTWRPDRTSSS